MTISSKPIISEKDFYKHIRKGILENKILAIYYSDESIDFFDQMINPLQCATKPNSVEVLVTYSDGKELRAILNTSAVSIAQICQDGIYRKDFIVAGKNIMVAKHVKYVHTHSIGTTNFYTVYFKEPIRDSDGCIVEDAIAIAFMVRNELGIERFKDSIEYAGRYDLLLNL